MIPAEKLGRSRIGRVAAKAYTLFSVMILFVFFRAGSCAGTGGERFALAFRLITLMFSGRGDAYSSYLLGSLLTPAACLVLVLAVLLAGNIPARLRAAFAASAAADSAVFEMLGHLCLLLLYALCVMSLARGGFNPFIYFQF